MKDETREKLIQAIEELQAENNSLKAARKKDMDSLKKAKKLMGLVHENYRSFLDALDEFIFILDDRIHIIHINAAVIEHLGYTQKELLGKPFFMVNPPGHQAEAAGNITAMVDGESDHGRVSFLTKSGIPIPVLTKARAGNWFH